MSTARRSRLAGARKRRLVPQFVAAAALVAGSALVLTGGQTINAGIVATVPLATSAGYSVLAGSTVTNTGPSVLGRSVGLSPGTAIAGFPPGIVLPPATIQAANAVTLQAQNDLTTAYVNAAGRPVDSTLPSSDLVGQTLLPGVHATVDKAPLSLSGTLTLDGQNNSSAVFIFQTNSTLITSSASSINLINGASACNVFWQVGSSATLGTGSDFVGTILALTSITVNNDVDVNGRALARNAAVTLDNDRFTSLSCESSPPATTTTTTPATTTPATTAPATTTPGTTTPATTTPGAATPNTTTPGAAGTATTTLAPATTFNPTDITLPDTGTGIAPEAGIATTSTPATNPPAPVTTFNPTTITLPVTGTGTLVTQSGIGFAALLIGLAAWMVARRRHPA